MQLPLASAIAAGISLGFYVMLDGLDLGVGALLPLAASEEDKDRMVASIAPVWDGNETWLIMAGIILLAAFPVAYGVLLPAFYLPLVVMLLCLGLRGVSFEFRFQTTRWRPFWDAAFAVGSILAALMQGVILGGLLQGVAVEGGRFTGSVTDIFGPLPLLTSVTVLSGYVVMGAAWLHLKMEGAERVFAERTLRWSAFLFAALILLTCILAARLQPQVGQAWVVHAPLYIAIAVGATLLLACLLYTTGRGLRGPLFSALGLFALGLIGASTLVFPYVVPYRMTLYEAASPTLSHVFLLAGFFVVVPVILAYSAFAYYVFRGPTPRGGWED